MCVIRIVYIYVSKDVRILGYFLKAKTGPQAEKFGRHWRKKERKWNANVQARFKHAAFVFKWQKVACALILRLV
jgi:hypothetical protein